MSILRFDEFEIDITGFKLTRDGTTVDVEPRVFDVIALLASNAGRILTRDEIVDKVWDGRFVGDAAITTSIKEARKALGDSGEAQRLIKTVRGRGYEFVGTIDENVIDRAPISLSRRSQEPLIQKVSFITSRDGTGIATASMGQGPVILRAAHWLSHVSLDYESPVFKHWFRAFSANHRFVRYDLRGSGLSDRDVSDMSFEAFLTDLEAVADTIDEPFTLFGMSQGGALSIAYALKHPEKVERLILFGAYGQGMVARATNKDERMMAETLINLIHLGWGRDNPAFNQIFTNLFIPGGTEEQHEWWRDLERNTATPETAARMVETNNQIDVFDLASQLDVPTLVFHCRNDARVPFDQGRKLAATIPGAHFVSLESANHVILEDEPAWKVFLSELSDYLSASNAPANLEEYSSLD